MKIQLKKGKFIREGGGKRELLFNATFIDEDGKEYYAETVALDKKGVVHCGKYAHTFDNNKVYKKLLLDDKLRILTKVPTLEKDYLSNIKD